MTFRQIECFIEAGNALNFTRAAEKLLIPQPAVSKNIATLEKELQVKLFFRDKKRAIHLTEEGQMYYQLFSQFYLDYKRINAQTKKKLPPLRFGYHIGWDLSTFLPDVIKSCRMDNPMFTIEVESYDPGDLEKLLLDQSIDAALMIDSYPVDHSRIEGHIITSIQQCIIYSDHLYPAPKSAILSPKDLADYPIFIVDDGKMAHARTDIEAFCHSCQFEPIIKTVKNTETVIANVDNGMGIAFYDEISRYVNNSRIRHLPISGRHDISLLHRKNDRSESFEIFQNNLINHFNR